MSVTIRLRRVGRKKQPSYRMVVADKASPRDGAYLDVVGFYNPRSKPAELRVDLEKVDRWVGQGAQLSDTAASLVRKARRGGDDTVSMVPMGFDSGASKSSAGPAAEESAEPPVVAEAASEVVTAAEAVAAPEAAAAPDAAAEPEAVAERKAVAEPEAVADAEAVAEPNAVAEPDAGNEPAA